MSLVKGHTQTHAYASLRANTRPTHAYPRMHAHARTYKFTNKTEL